jgi:hypothetical protein
MLKWFAAIAPPIALLMVGVLLLEPPALTPRERVPTLRLLARPAPEMTRDEDIVLAPAQTPSPSPGPAPDRAREPRATAADIELPVEQRDEGTDMQCESASLSRGLPYF